MQADLDATDGLLLELLQRNARLTSGELAQMANLSQSPCWRRIRRLEENGVIGGYHARLNRRAIGYGVMAFVMISIEYQNEARSVELQDAVRAIPEVVMFHGVSGPEDFILVVVARDLDAYSELLQHKLHRLPGVRQVRTCFSLQEFKGFDELPIPADLRPK